MSTHINDLREHLMATLASLRDRENPMEPDRARAVAQVAGVLVDTARAEIDYIKATGADRSDFLEPAPTLPRLASTPTAHNPFPVSASHRLEG
jgi:hypothetical protein